MQLTQPQIDDELRFWLNQDKEHMLFYSLGFVDPGLKSESTRLYEAYESALSRDDLKTGLQILSQSQAFKERALALASTRWVGWIYPLFIDHTRRELTYMLARVQPGGVSPRDMLCFGNRINSEHCAFAAQLLDPTETAVQNAAQTAKGQSGAIANQCMTETYPTLLQLSQRSGSAIDQMFSGLNLASTKSIIHPALAAHVVREGKRFMSTIATLPTVE